MERRVVLTEIHHRLMVEMKHSGKAMPMIVSNWCMARMATPKFKSKTNVTKTVL